MPLPDTIAYFITPHGFGHASRSAAVMAELVRIKPKVRLELFTTCPREIFQPEIPDGFGYHAVTGDIGMVQKSPLFEDLPATCDALDRMLPFDDQRVDLLADQLIGLKCRLVICDIAALGIAAARRAGIASLLIENFTWDWIYRGYLSAAPGLDPHIQYLSDTYSSTDHHIQTIPLCRVKKGAHSVGPISRRSRRAPAETRRRLGIAPGEKMVLVTMGGVADGHRFLSRLPEQLPCRLVISGAQAPHVPHKQVVTLPTHSAYYHPDLMRAAHAVVGKAGYSTVAEAYHAGVPFGYVKRPHSPESAVLEAFIDGHLPSQPIDTAAYSTGGWIDQLPDLLELAPRDPMDENGATDTASIIEGLME